MNVSYSRKGKEVEIILWWMDWSPDESKISHKLEEDPKKEEVEN